MKINFVGINGYDFPYTRVRCFHFAEKLKEHGFDTDVLSFRDHLAPQYTGIQMLGLGEQEKISLNLEAFKRLYAEPDALLYIQKLHYHSVAPYTLSRMGRNKYVFDYDDWDVDRSPLFDDPFLNKLFLKSSDPDEITRTVAREAALCVASSRFLEKYLRESNPNVLYVPTGVDIERFSLDGAAEKRNKKNSFTFVWTGQIWGKVIYDNIVFLLRCFKQVYEQEKNVSFLIVGGGDWMKHVRETISSDFSHSPIEIIDWVHPDKMPEFLSGVHAGLLPLIPDSENETWMKSKSPTKFFEYMAMELPTVSTRFGEIKEVVEEGVDGFLADGVEEFSEKMLALAKNSELCASMGAKARAKVEKDYSLAPLVQRLAKALRHCH